MTAVMLAGAEEDLEQAFDYYQAQRQGLGVEMLQEFRRAVDQILEHPSAWQPMDEIYRRCRLHRFPYGVVYRIDEKAQQIVIVSVMHLSRRPGFWQ